MKKKPPRRHQARQPAALPSRPHPRHGEGRGAAPGGSAVGEHRRTVHAREVVPHDPSLFTRSHEQWVAADWQSLAQLPAETLAHHPDRARLSVLCTAAALQLGDRHAARSYARRAMEWGCDRRFLGQVLLTGARNTLGRASFAAGREQKADAHFEKSVAMVRMSSEVRRLAQGRRDRVATELRSAVAASAALRKAGGVQTALNAPAWLTGLADRCFLAADIHDSADHALASTLTLADDKVRFLMLLSDRFLSRGDRLTALHFLAVAREYAKAAEPALRAELTRKLLAAGGADSAVDALVEQGLADSAQIDGDERLSAALEAAYTRMRAAAQSHTEHGHELLLHYLESHLAQLRAHAQGRKLTLIEIGTTREDVPGQGSTRKLAAYCQQHGLHFITVDMDPHNSRMARQTFVRLGADFEAVTMKGEDYLRGREGPIDLVFLDAYDFDHGKHSDLRQSRYQKFMGSPIDDEACHRMHLDCAQTLAAKLWLHGVVCIDDTWLEQDRWAAKGTLAMPFLLDNGFTLVEARNRAALLLRAASSAAA